MAFWKRLFADDPKTPRWIEHPRLGRIQFDADEDLWVATISIEGEAIRLLFGGVGAPDERLVSHGEAIAADFERLALKVRDLVETEAASKPRYSEEIRRLQISDVCLLWPDRPDDGMIYFKGPDGFRVWRCDYIGHVPQSLGFDS